MKQIDFIHSENVVIMASPKKRDHYLEAFQLWEWFVLSAATDKKIILIQKKQFSAKILKLCQEKEQ